MFGIANFDQNQYDNAMSFILPMASKEFIEKVLAFNVKVESTSTMEGLLEIMRDLYSQIKKQK